MHHGLSSAALMALLLLPLGSHAEGRYLKIGAGQSRYSVDLYSDNTTGGLLAYGVALDKIWGIEGGYSNLGRLGGLEDDFGNPASLLTQAVYAAGTARRAMTTQLSLHATLGLAVKYFSGGDQHATMTSLMGGVGTVLQLDRRWGTALEYTHYGKSDGLTNSMTTLAATYHF